MKMRKSLKICIMILLLIVFASTVLSGCNVGGSVKTDEKAKSEGEPDIKDPYKERIKITAIHRHTAFGSVPFVEDDKVIEYIENKYNMDLEVIFVPTSAAGGVDEKLNMMISSGEIPDLILTNPTAVGLAYDIYRSLISEGKLIEMKSYIDKNSQRYPKLSENVYDNETERLYEEDDGKLYAIPRYYGQWPHAYYIRADWLDSLNLKKPTTLEELKDVLKKFVEADPDDKGNVGLTTGGIWWLRHLYAGFTGIQDFGVLNGEIVSQWEMPAQKDAMKYINLLYKENLLDKDVLATMPSGGDRSKFSSGKAGVLIVDAGFLNGIDKALSEYSYPSSAKGCIEIIGIFVFISTTIISFISLRPSSGAIRPNGINILTKLSSIGLFKL
jgi:putative aldouronate transport system substrate-binding protein